MDPLQGRSIAIVGGGIIGMSTAWRLAQAGASVTVYEKSIIGCEASWAGAGMLAPGGEFDRNSRLAQYAIASRDLYRKYVEELQASSGLEIDFQETGALDVAYSNEELAGLDERAERQRGIGIPCRRVSPDQIATFWPHLRHDGLTGGYFYPGDASVDPRHVVAALRIACRDEGVDLWERSHVQQIQVEETGVCIEGRPHDAVVIAAGAWSGSLSVRGVPPIPASEPVKGHLIGYQQPQQVCGTIVRHQHTYLLQRAAGLLIAGASVEHAGFDRSLNSSAAAELARQAAQLFPHLEETSPTQVWNGFRPASDELRLGPWHSPRLLLAYGHYRNGILLAPFTAKFLTGEISASSGTQRSA